MPKYLLPTIIACCAIALLNGCSSARAGITDWPQFRGPSASGFQNDMELPTTWDVAKGEGVAWKTPIPGLAHSSPVVWGDRVYLTSAVSENPNPTLRVGLYGESPEHPEEIVHDFNVYCLDLATGKILWQQTAHSGIPKVKRHIKSTHANSSPATDGKHVVALFGSEGLYCYDTKGKLLWKKDLGYLNSGAFNAAEVQWAFGSSPIIYEDKVIVQCDVNNQSFITALEIGTGKEIWRKNRDEFPGWSTPTVHESDGRKQVIVNGYHHIGGYDVETGEELWRMSGGGDIPVPTPFVSNDLIFITNAHGRLRPIYAIRTNAKGDISLKDGEKSNGAVSWAELKKGAYMPTPIAYGEYLYVGDDRGILTCYKAKTGEKAYRVRLAGKAGTYSASPVAADGKLFFADEQGQIHVVKAGPEYELLATNEMGEICMATPAIADNMLLIRTTKHLYAISK